jgi:hypothetical protein
MYSVVWDSVDPQLLNYWLAASSKIRRAITTASNRLDRRLSQNPRAGVVSQDPDFYSMTESPLRIYYKIDDATRKVVIEAVAILPGTS